MRGEGTLEEVAPQAGTTPLPITLALLVWLTVALTLVAAAVLGGVPPAS